MEIGLIYSSKDPRQAETRQFVREFVRKRGILARIVEQEQPVDHPTIVINGQTLKAAKNRARKALRAFPSHEDIAKALERSLWGL